MRSSIILVVLSAAVLGGCSSAYRTGQTPDDIYYSPQRPQAEYLNVKDDDNRYYGDQEYYDDQYLRMKVHNRSMWSELDDYYYYNPVYSYSYYSPWNWNNPWSPFTYWNYYYNPYCSPVIFGSKPGLFYNHPRIFNLNTYNSNQLTNSNYTKPRGSMYNNNSNSYYNNNSYSRPVRMVGVNNSNNGSSTGNFLRNIFNNSSNSSNNSSYSPGRSSSSSSGSSSRSGSAPVRRF